MNVGNSERLDVLQWLDGYTIVAVSMTSKLLKVVVERHRGILPLRVVDSCALPQSEYFDYVADVYPLGDGIMQFYLAIQNAAPMVANEPAFKLLRNCALGSLVINDGGHDAEFEHSTIRMLQEFFRRVPVKALELFRVWGYGFDIFDILPIVRGLEQLTLVECDVLTLCRDGSHGFDMCTLLNELLSLGITYTDIRFALFRETINSGVLNFLLGSNKVCSSSGRRELHISTVYVSEGFFKKVVKTFLGDRSSTPLVLTVNGDDIVDDNAFDSIADDVSVEDYRAYTRAVFDKCPTPFEVLFSEDRIELYRACRPENSKLIEKNNTDYSW